MHIAQRIAFIFNQQPLPLLRISTLGLCVFLAACQKNETENVAPTPEKIELIQQDLVTIQQGSAIEKTAFTGTVRAVNQSSIQSQVSATATSVNVKVGDAVQRGQTLVRLNNQDNAARLAQARANLAATQAQANQARNMMQRKKRLLDQGFISQVEYEQSQLDYRAQIENVRVQQANVDIALKADQDGTITSPIRGVITQRQVEPGQTVAVGQTLFEVVDPSRLEIQAKLPSDLQAALKVGQKIEYQLQGHNNTLNAQISRVSPVADLASRQIEFFATPLEALPSLSIGAFVDGHILASNQISGQIIPLNTIHNIENKPYVWVIRDQKIARIDVTVLEQRYSDNTAVIQGLQPNDLVSRVSFQPDQIQQPVIIQKQPQ
ncbi:efflux RND transporter periplasmic adaptor subunit [Acinetobacter towneri]|uniref:efflux RND transporter periplasmic adaptor subunit n=1 Tax=Acinetobacter towneri TaxID=202956 RepID=UPI002DBB23DD|nr:efflux RND transporter periplasmic adaptor subunit [Acinetobacter towneri]MEB6566025.1 efflux RND transporter periplasmic adaptor subunit [Acinetobacter towneri]